MKDSRCIVCGNNIRGAGARASIRDITVCTCGMHSESVNYEKQELFGLQGISPWLENGGG